ncbi:MAG: phosphatidate cytidylyltransferase [Pseudomonadales bacterium]|nr:phosphatidate cytidylyltransferase [Pseudomonadales bacterium]
MAAVVTAAIVFLDVFWFSIASGAVMALAATEWGNLAGLNKPLERAAYGIFFALFLLSIHLFLSDSRVNLQIILGLAVAWWLFACFLVLRFPAGKKLWSGTILRLTIGVIVLSATWLGLVDLKQRDIGLVFFAIALIAFADIGAYATGRTIGRNKLAPQISPGKTWEGLFGGAAASVCLAIFAGFYFKVPMLHVAILVALTIAVVIFSVVGDLTVSMLKRDRGLKDCGKLLPGHGGLMDRLDSICAAIPLIGFVISFSNWGL